MQPERLPGFYKKHEKGGQMAASFHALEKKSVKSRAGAEPHFSIINTKGF